MSHGLTPRRHTPRRLTSRIVALTAAAVVLGGCSDEGDGEAAPTPSTSSLDSEPAEPTSSAAPEVPELPEAATGTDDAAAVAFVEHWVELVNYAIVTGDAEPARAVTGAECVVCDAILDEFEASGGPESTDTWSLSSVETRGSGLDDLEDVDTVVSADVSLNGVDPDPYGTLEAGLTQVDGGWQLTWLLNERY